MHENPYRLKICLIGRIRVGNRFAAFRLQRVHGFRRKKMMAGVDKFSRFFYKYGKYDRFISWEKKLEFYDALYKIDQNIHVDYLLRRVESGWEDVVVEDVRYLNEVQKLKDNGFTVIRITPSERTRPKIVNFDNALPGTVTVNEWFAADPNKFPTDYSFIYDNKAEAAATVDNIVNRLRQIREKQIEREPNRVL
jgi:hypothetical protein